MASKSASTSAGESPRCRARETALALLISLLLAALPLARGLFDPSVVAFGVDTASTQLPWSALHPQAGVVNPSISDQGVGFYPFYRWVSDSWLAGDPPLWNPLVYAGSPGFGNPQYGALDPQVWVLVGMRALWGDAGLDYGLVLVAWLRLAAAGLGAYLLARCLGLRRPACALAGVGFGLSGYLVLWLNFSLGHVPPWLPWILLGLEGCRGPRWRAGMALAGLCLAGAIVGGHPETSFFCGAAAGGWALSLLRRERAAGLRGLLALLLGSVAASASLLPFVEYLQRSAAQVVRQAQAEQLAWNVDLLALGLLALVIGLLLSALRQERVDEVHIGGHDHGQDHARGPQHGHEHEHKRESQDERARLARVPESAHTWRNALGLGLAFAGLFLLLAWRGLPAGAWLSFAHDALGAPGTGQEGYRGLGSYVEEASGWMPLTVLGFAFAALIGWVPRPAQDQRFAAHRPLLLVLGFGAWLLCLRAPGLDDLYRHLPLVGLGATVRLGCVSALFLSLIAAQAFELAPRSARAGAALALALLVGLPLFSVAPHPSPELSARLLEQPEADELVGFLLVPPRETSAPSAQLEGWIDARVPVSSVRVSVQALDQRGEVDASFLKLTLPCERTSVPSAAALGSAQAAAVPAGATFFRSAYLQLNRLPAGTYSFRIELITAADPPDSEPASRLVANVRVLRHWKPSALTLILAAAGLGAVLLAPAQGWGAWLVVVLALAQGLWFARGMTPFVPREQCFPWTQTERILAREQGTRRFFSDPEVLPPDTGLVRGLRALDGYDGLNVAAFDDFKRWSLLPGRHALLNWNARGVDFAAPAFRLLGVGHLVLSTPLEDPAWELIAGPGLGAPEFAETWIYRARAPLPRAFVVARAVAPEDLLASLQRGERWDPLELAALSEAWQPTQALHSATVGEPRFLGNNRVELEAKLDGDGLLVLTEQHFPGWRVQVDGEPREVLAVDGIFRGVPLGQGEHRLVFEYAPASVRYGVLLSCVALVALLLLACVPRRVARA